jgi:putative superfamily III holin-X
VGQAKVNGGSATRSHGDKNASAEGMVGNVAEIANDVLTLAEFQAKLAALDFREAAGKAAVPIGLTMAGLVLLAASLPVVLLSLAWLLATALQIHVGWAMLMTASVAMALAGIAGGFGATRLIRSFDSFRRSQEELSRNLSWVRTVLRYRGQDDDRSQSDLSKSAHGRSPGSGH